jgi:hypothetical protein
MPGRSDRGALALFFCEKKKVEAIDANSGSNTAVPSTSSSILYMRITASTAKRQVQQERMHRVRGCHTFVLHANSDRMRMYACVRLLGIVDGSGWQLKRP